MNIVLISIVGIVAGLAMLGASVWLFVSLIWNSVEAHKMRKKQDDSTYGYYYTTSSRHSASHGTSTSYTPAYDMSGKHIGWYDNSRGVTLNITKTGVIVPSIEPKK